MFDAGALVFTIRAVGAQIFKRDMGDAEQAVERTGKASQTAAGQVDKLGGSSDETSKKAKAAKGPLDEQAKSSKKVGDESDESSKKQRKQAEATQEQISAAKELAGTLTIAGGAIAALVGLAIAKNVEFDQAMSNVRAATMSTAAEQQALGEAALEAGADTAYSASEAAAAQEELAKAGQSVSQIIGGSLNGALALAAAGQLQVARSAEIMATTLTQFRLPAEQAAHVSDVLAAGAGKAQGSVDDLSLALSYVGPLAGSVGFSLDQTAGTLAYFATQGIIGEKAGTSLRGVLASLQAPSAAAAGEMERYGINMFDANGKMLSLSGIAEQLKTRLGGLTQQERLAALGRIFGNESLNAATLLYEGGAAAVEQWTAAVDDTGYAAEQAAMRQDNLAGDIEKLGGAFDTALIRTGTAANDVLRGMTQTVTELVDQYAEWPEPIQTTTMVLGVATAATLLFAGGAVGARAKFLELKLALDQTSTSMGRTALIGGAVGLALTGVIAVVGLLATKQAEARAKTEAYADTLEEGTNRVTKATREMAKENLAAADSFLWFETPSAFDKAESLGLSLERVTDAAMGSVPALKELKQAQEEYQAVVDADRERGDTTSVDDTRLQSINAIIDAVNGENRSIDESIRKAEQKQDADENTAQTSRTAAEAYVETSESVEGLNNDLRNLIDTIMSANQQNLDAREANRQLIDSLADFDAVLEKNGATLDLNTEAGRENEAALDNIAQRAMAAAESTTAAGGSYDEYRASLENSRQALLDRIHDLGIQGEEAEALADKILGIPTESQWRMIAETYAAQQKIDEFIITNSGKKIPIKIIADGSAFKLPDFGGRVISAPDYADGAVVSYHANGSVSEHHVAQIARAGEYRVWAEPETEGEGYVPLARSKRARSEVIMGELADRMGGRFIPASAMPYADGSAPVGARHADGRGGMHVDRIDVNLPATDPEIAAWVFADKLWSAFASTPGR